ncbi:MAG: winged helix DNA-binding domain-containing protein [Micromonosporaceae bacterium]|jgi:hypothetical protein
MARRPGSRTGGGGTTEIGLLRIVAQRLAGPRFDTPAGAVRWLTAMQAQDFPGVLTSVALRTAARDRAAVVAALDAGEIVRSWPMRGTLHLVPAEDLVWLLRLLTPRALAKAATRRANLGLDEATIERARALAVDALAGGGRLSRDELMAVWQDGGVDTTGQRGYHLLGHLAQSGTLCLGPVKDGEQLIVRIDEWIPHPRLPEREEALGELAERYFRSHGPATLKDFLRWTGLTATEARVGIAVARPRLATIEVDGVEHLLDPGTPDLLAAHRTEAEEVLLLPGFDELILGYADRTATVPAEYAGRIVPGGNGMFRPTVIAGGRAVGTWRHRGTGARRRIDAEPFDTFPAPLTTRIEEAYAALP